MQIPNFFIFAMSLKFEISQTGQCLKSYPKMLLEWTRIFIN